MHTRRPRISPGRKRLLFVPPRAHSSSSSPLSISNSIFGSPSQATTTTTTTSSSTGCCRYHPLISARPVIHTRRIRIRRQPNFAQRKRAVSSRADSSSHADKMIRKERRGIPHGRDLFAPLKQKRFPRVGCPRFLGTAERERERGREAATSNPHRARER